MYFRSFLLPRKSFCFYSRYLLTLGNLRPKMTEFHTKIDGSLAKIEALFADMAPEPQKVQLCVYLFMRIHTYIHTYIHPHIHTPAHSYTHTCTYTCTCTNQHPHAHMLVHVHVHMNIYIYTQQTQTHTHTHTRTHAHTHTHITGQAHASRHDQRPAARAQGGR